MVKITGPGLDFLLLPIVQPIPESTGFVQNYLFHKAYGASWLMDCI